MTTRSQIARTIGANLTDLGFAPAEIVGAKHAFVRVTGDVKEAVLFTVAGNFSDQYVEVQVALRFNSIQIILEPLMDHPELRRHKESLLTLKVPLYNLDRVAIPKAWRFREGDNGVPLGLEMISFIKKYGLQFLEQLTSIRALHKYLTEEGGLSFAYSTKINGLRVLLATSHILRNEAAFAAALAQLEEPDCGPQGFVQELKRFASELVSQRAQRDKGPESLGRLGSAS